MLTAAENATMTQIGPGTPMGAVFRRFWHPALLSEELPTADCDPLRIRILGEDLVAFRDTEGRAGIVDALCPHRRAPMYNARNEDCGLRCVYHGWKFDVHGQCVDMPSEPPSDVQARVQARTRIKAYPVQEAGGLIWIYMGPAEHRPGTPPMVPFMRVAPHQRTAVRYLIEANWLQGLEGDLDTAHLSFLHSKIDSENGAQLLVAETFSDRHPNMSLIETDYGLVYGGRRTRPAGDYYWRCTQWVLPSLTLVAPLGNYHIATMWVPIDDFHSIRYVIRCNDQAESPPDRSTGLNIFAEPFTLRDGTIIDAQVPEFRKSNNYGLDRKMQRTVNFTGLKTVQAQDQAILEGMGAICDRSGEQLSATDLAVNAMRRRLQRVYRELATGSEPHNQWDDALSGIWGLDVVSAASDLFELLAENKLDGGLEEAKVRRATVRS
jgi:phthalate 4,5-dioxygenase oxygenase subunit